MKYGYGEDSCNKCLINFLGVINLNKLVYIFVSKPNTFSYSGRTLPGGKRRQFESGKVNGQF